jgi:hypothetical protein
MFAKVVEVTGNPDPFEQPPQQIPTCQRNSDEDEVYAHMLRKARLDPKPREHDDLCRDCQKVAQHNVYRGFDQRHGARLVHAVPMKSESISARGFSSEWRMPAWAVRCTTVSGFAYAKMSAMCAASSIITM